MIKPHSHQRSKPSRKSKGFTLIEFVAVLVFIGILISALMPVITDANLDRKITTAKTDIGQYARAIQKTYRTAGLYPADIAFDDIKHHLPKGTVNVNPWGAAYVFAGGGITYGADCDKTARTTDTTLFHIDVVLPGETDDAVMRFTDDYDDCTASSSGTTISFEYE